MHIGQGFHPMVVINTPQGKALQGEPRNVFEAQLETQKLSLKKCNYQ